MASSKPLSIVELQHLREAVGRLLVGEESLQALVDMNKAMFLPNSYLTTNILIQAGIQPTNQYGYTVAFEKHTSSAPPDSLTEVNFSKPVAVLAMSFISELLENHRTRKHVIDSVLYSWKPAYHLWLIYFLHNLSPKACVHLLLEAPLKGSGKLKALDLRGAAIKAMQSEKIPGVVACAADAKKLPELYALSQWPECRTLGSFADRKKMISSDFEI